MRYYNRYEHSAAYWIVKQADKRATGERADAGASLYYPSRQRLLPYRGTMIFRCHDSPADSRQYYMLVLKKETSRRLKEKA